MNDKFNDDDFSWLTNPDDDSEKKDDSSQDDDQFSWQQSGGSRPAEQGGKSLGFTGQLSWMKDAGDESGSQGEADDEGFAWQNDEGDAPATPNRTGLTGTLSWQRASQPEKSSEDWMSDLSSAMGKMSEADDEEPSSTPDWLQSAAPQAPKEAQASGDMPDWLQGADVDDFGSPAAAQQDTFEAPDDDVPDWLKGDADDMFSAPTPAAASSPAAGDIPDWLSGMDDETPEPQAAASADVPSLDDLFGDDQPPSWEPAASVSAADDVPDWLSDMGSAIEPEPPAAASPDVPSLDDLFGDESAEQPEWEPAPWDAQPAQEQEDFPEDDLFPPDEDEDFEQPAAAPLDTGFLAGLGLSKSEPAEAVPSASVDDFLASLGFDDDEGAPALSSTPAAPAPAADEFDWFAAQPEEAAPVEQAAPDDWLAGLGDLDTLSELTEEAELPEPFPAAQAHDIFADFETEEPSEPAAPQYQDIDALMSSFGDDEMDLPKTDELKLSGDDIDFDTLLNQDALGDVGRKKPQPMAPEFGEGASDLLADLGVTVGQVSASSIMRQQQDRPLEELSDRLQALRERSLEAPASAPAPRASTSLAGVLPGGTETLAPTVIPTGTPGIAGTVILSKEQQDRVALLRQLTGGTAATHGDGDAPYTDWASELPAETAAKTKAKPAVRPRRRFSLKVDRLLISVLLIAVIVLPFVFDGARIGTLPPVQFASGSSQLALYDSINSLNAGDLVLVAVEYGPTAAAELDSMTDVVLRHILSRGAHPVVISRNPVGLLHAGNLLRTFGGTANQDYYLARYLTADIVGLSSLAQNIGPTLATDVNGNATGLNVTSLDNFAGIVVIVERAEDLRAWAEQIAPMTSAPLFAGTNYASAPLSQPYLNASASAGVQGMLVGTGDAYTYRAMLEGWTAQSVIPATPTPETSTEVAPTPTQEAIIDTTAEATTETTVEATATRRVIIVTPTQQAVATNTLEPSPTREELSPTAVTPSATPTPRPTDTPTVTPTIEPVQVFAVVSVNDSINIRAEPSRDAARVSSARPGTRLEVIGISEDGLWLNVRTAEGTEGWVLGELVTIEASPSPKLAAPARRTRGSDLNQDTPEATPEASADGEATVEGEAAAETTEAANITPTLRPTRPVITPATATPAASSLEVSTLLNEDASAQQTRDQQWYATTLGLVFIVVVIVLGNLANIIRGLLRRSRTR
ncbi:MAG: SH3 domain-containing protein [Anaerolineae bacterium]